MAIHQEDAFLRLDCYKYVDKTDNPSLSVQQKRLAKIYRWVAHGISDDTSEAPPSTDIINRDQPRIRIRCLETMEGNLKFAILLYTTITGNLTAKP